MKREGFSAQVGLFQAPPTETGQESTTWVQIRPKSQIISGGVIEFSIPGNTLQYLNAKKTKLHIQGKLVKKDGSALEEADIVTPINLFLHSLWSQMEVTVQQKSLSPGISTRYPYKAMLDLLVNMNKNEQVSIGSCMMYYRDATGNMEANTPTAIPISSGVFNRNSRSKLSKIFDMEGPLYSDIFQQDRLLLNGLQVGIRLYPTSEAFRLLSDKTEYKVEIIDAILKVCYVKVSPGILLGHSEALKIGPARYFFDNSVIKTYAIAKGQYSITVDDLFQGDVPNSLILTLVSSEALNGSFAKNPYNFQNFNLNFCAFYVDGQSSPSQALQPSFSNGTYTEAYLTAVNETPQNGITFDEFKSGYTIYVFDLKQHDKHVLTERKKGHTRMEIRFSEALPHTTTLLAYAKFNQELRVDESRTVTIV